MHMILPTFANAAPIGGLIVGAIILVTVLWLFGTYNGLVRLRQHVRESWSGIDVELKRRHDLIPNLVKTVKGYAAHERETLERVIEARNAAAAVSDTGNSSSESLVRSENEVTGALRGLFALAEGYPELKSNTSFLALQRELSNTEDRIAASRRFYNANVRDMNTRCRTIPSSVVAGMGGFEPAEYFEIEDASVRLAPEVTL